MTGEYDRKEADDRYEKKRRQILLIKKADPEAKELERQIAIISKHHGTLKSETVINLIRKEHKRIIRKQE